MAKFSDYHGVLSVKDPAFGALGNGVANDGPAIQACFNAAFGTRASPHGNTGKYTNRGVYFPPGNYNVGAPLTLFKVFSGHIFGAGSNCTRLAYTGAFSGNDVRPDTSITPLIITDGFANSVFEGINLSMPSTNTGVCFDLYWDGTGGAGPTQNTFADVLTDTADVGFLIGYETPGLCSEQLFLNCTGNGHSLYCFRNISSNALNNTFVCCGASSCGVGFSCPTGSIEIYTASLAGNTTDIATGQNTMAIIGVRTESANFVDTTASSNVPHFIAGCIQDSDAAGAGYFCNVAGPVVIEGCTSTGTASNEGVIQGSSGKVYLRGNDFRNTSYLGSYTGTVAELDIPVGLVSALPTAATKYKGLRAVVTDATVTTFASTVAGTGGNIVPVFCDGTNWKIG